MPYSIEKLSDKNVILVTFTGLITRVDVIASMKEVVVMADSLPRPIYQIGDFRQAEGTFSSVFEIVRTFPMMWRLYANNNITGPIAVNDLNNPWLKMSHTLALKIRLKEMLMFPTIEDALHYIQNQEVI